MAGNMEQEVLIVREFLDEAACRRVRLAMDAGTPEPAELLDEDFSVDGNVRRASLIEVDEGTRQFLEARLDAQRAVMSRFYGLELTEREGLGILRYQPGGFFKRHRDRAVVASWPGAARRQIAVVVFLTTSREADAMGTFSGGTLRLLGEGAAPDVEVHPRAGTLLAFPAETLHEVTPVQSGIRDAIVDWYY